MKNTIKFAAIGAVALAATSTAAFAGSTATPELPAGVTTGLALGAPLPEGVYDISIASYGSSNDGGGANVAYAIPVWLIWSTPYQIAGGRIMLDTLTGVVDTWGPGSAAGSNVGVTSFLNTLVDGGIAWSLGNGWNVGLHAGAWLPSTQTVPLALGRKDAAFQGMAAVSYVAHGWNLSATGIYNEGGNGHTAAQSQDPYFNLDLTATRKFGKMEIGSIAYGSWQLDCAGNPKVCSKANQFALGGLVGYDFGSFIAQAKLAGDVATSNAYGEKEVRGTVTIIKPLWNPEAGSLK